jgi:hypothetical protein
MAQFFSAFSNSSLSDVVSTQDSAIEERCNQPWKKAFNRANESARAGYPVGESASLASPDFLGPLNKTDFISSIPEINLSLK